MKWLKKAHNINSQTDNDDVILDVSDTKKLEILKNYISSFLEEGFKIKINKYKNIKNKK